MMSRRTQWVAAALMVSCLQSSAFESRSTPARSFAALNFPETFTSRQIICVFVLVALIIGLTAVATVRRLQAWRQSALRRRDEEMLKMIDGWTRHLREQITERKQAELALQDSQKVILRQERLAAVGQLTSGLAHEFNNIMTIVQGHAALLAENSSLDFESRKSVNYITESVERMSKLVRQMLAFSRKQIMQQKALDVDEAVGGVADILGRLLGEQIVLKVDLAPEIPAIMADPDMLQQALVNLAVNARDAMDGHGQLTIRATVSTFTSAATAGRSDRKPGRYVCLAVTDTGSGMDAETIAHLFEPFFTTKDVGKGPGLGLATVHGIVNQHKGWIEVNSKPGQGTTFELYLPTTEQKPEAFSEQVAPGKEAAGTETVLVVEDESMLRELVKDLLTMHGYRVLEAANGHEALEIWQANRESVNLLLTDIAMPRGISGHDLVRQIRAQAPKLPVVFSSGYSHEMVERAPVRDEDTAFLFKPYHPGVLARTVRDTLDSARKRETPAPMAAS